MLEAVNQNLAPKGIRIATDTILAVDFTSIALTRNEVRNLIRELFHRELTRVQFSQTNPIYLFMRWRGG